MEPPAAFQERSTSRLAEIGRVWGPWLAYRLMVLLVWWTVLYCLPLIGVTIAPGGTGFALGLLYGVSVLGSFLIKKVAAGVPALLGMLLAGLMLRNGHVAVFDEPYLTGQDPLLGHTFEWWSLTLRSWALSIIMLRAGLGLDLDKLKTMGAVTARLACGPCLAEAATVALFAGPLLGLPPAWGGLLGFVIAAVSPAVVVPGMLDMQTRRLGTKKGVPSMVIAAASFDDVLAIAGFGICLALALPDVAKEGSIPSVILREDSNRHDHIAFVKDAVQHGDGAQSVAITLLKAPLELLAGVAVGVLCGMLVAMPVSRSLSPTTTSIAAVGFSFLCVSGGKMLDLSGGGVLATIVLGCTAGRVWSAAERTPVQATINWLWGLAQPALFGLLGSSVDLSVILPETLFGAVALLACSLLVRISVTRLVMLPCGTVDENAKLTPKEAKFICIAWLPKATVQAAVGGLALDRVHELGHAGTENEAYAKMVLMISVMVILLTAPVGAIGIAIFGPKLLSHDTIEDTQRPSELDLVASATTPIKSPPPSPPADEV